MTPAIRRVVLNQSLERQVLAILRRLGGSLYIPSPSTCWQDSTGISPCTVDSPVGLMLDTGQGGLSAVSDNRAVNGDFNTDLSGWTQGVSGYWTWVNGRAYHASSASYNELGQTFTGITGPVIVRGTIEVASGQMIVFVTENPVTSTKTRTFNPGTYTFSFIINGITKIGASRAGDGGEGYIDNISVQSFPGNHATQATSGFRPLLRGAVKNLTTYSVPTTGQWATQFTGTASSPTVTYDYATSPLGTGAARIQMDKGAGTTSADLVQFMAPAYNAIVGLTYTSYIWLKTTDGSTKQVSLRDGINNTLVTVTGTWQRFSRTGVATNTSQQVGIRLRGTEGTDSTADILVADAQVTVGSASQANVTTTSTPASSSYGPYWLDFDGTDDYLQFTNMPTQLAGDSFVGVASIRLGNSSNWVDVGNAGSVNQAAPLIFTNDSGSSLYYRDDSLVTAVATQPIINRGTPIVLLGYKRSNLVALDLNNKESSSVLYSGNTTSVFNGARFGTRVSGGTFVQGGLYGVLIGAGSLSNPNKRKLSTYLGKLMGLSI